MSTFCNNSMQLNCNLFVTTNIIATQTSILSVTTDEITKSNIYSAVKTAEMQIDIQRVFVESSKKEEE